MSQQRLSKLQKWILTRCYGTLDRAKGFESGLLFRHEIVTGYYSQANNTAEVSTSRAIKSLVDKGLVTGHALRTLKYSDEQAIKILEGKKPDVATLLAWQIGRKTENKQQRAELYDKAMTSYMEKYKPSDKLLSPVLKKEAIKVIALTESGKEAARRLLLTYDSRQNLTIKPRKRGYNNVHFLD